MKRFLLIISFLLITVYSFANYADNKLSTDSIIFIVDTNTQHSQIEQMKWPDGNEYIYLHLYDKNGEWVKRGIFRDAKCEAIEITPTQLNELNVGIIDFAQFVAANDKHAIWTEINKYERSGHPIYIIDVAEKTEDCIKLYPALGFMSNTSDLDHH